MRYKPCAVDLEAALDLVADLLPSALPISRWGTLEIHKLLKLLDDDEIDEVYQRWPVYHEVMAPAELRRATRGAKIRQKVKEG